MQRIYGDDAVDPNPEWMMFGRKLLMVATRLKMPAFGLAPQEADERACEALRVNVNPALDVPKYLPFAILFELNFVRLHEISVYLTVGERIEEVTKPLPDQKLTSMVMHHGQCDQLLHERFQADESHLDLFVELLTSHDPRPLKPDSEIALMFKFRSGDIEEQGR